MSCGIIYKIEFPNGKHYIGLTTTSLKRRKAQHKNCAKSGDNHCLYNALRKYEMVDTFELIEIDTADTLEKLYEKEIEYILTCNSHYIDGYGYNMTYGGDGNHGYVFTEEVKQKMRDISKKRFEENPEAGKEHGERMRNMYQENPEARIEQSKRMINYFKNPEAREKHSERMKKILGNPEARQKNSERMKNFYQENPEAGKKISERLITFNQKNPEARIEYGKKRKKFYKENPEARKKCSERMKKLLENPEEKIKFLDAKGKNKPFDVFTVDGTFVKTFTYQFEAREYLQKEHHITTTILISTVLAERKKSSAGFVFKYK